MKPTALTPALTIAAVLLSGCAQLDRISHGSWLDQIGKRAPARYPYTPEETQALSARALELHARADAVRVKLAGEKDRVQRFEYLRELEDIGDEMVPIEKTLRAGGTNSRRVPLPPDYTQAGGT